MIGLLAVAALAGCQRDRGAKGDAATLLTHDPAAPKFRDVTRDAGIDVAIDVGDQRRHFFPEIMCGGAALFDCDGDQDLDIYIVNAGSPPIGDDRQTPRAMNRLLRQEDDGRFVDATEESGLGDRGYGMGVAIGDINNDGRPDVYVSNFGPDRLYLNQGGGAFVDITKQAGIENLRWGASVSLVDYDRDGWLDVFVTNYVDYQPFEPCRDAAGREDYCNPMLIPNTPDKLYRNLTGASADGQPKFEDVSVAAGIAEKSGAGLGLLCADFNGDGWPDIYVANDGHANFLWVNQQNGAFRDEAVLLGLAYDSLGRGQASMGLAGGDLNSDGALDVLATHLEGENNAVYLSSASGAFSERSRELGLAAPSMPWTGFGAVLADLDHDGDLDAAIVNGRVRRDPARSAGDSPSFWDDYAEPNQLLVRDERFSLQAHPDDDFSRGRGVTRALAVGDLDNDGDLDLLTTQIAGPVRLFRNETSPLGHWLNIRAVDPSAGGRDAIGSVVTVVAAGLTHRRIVNPGAGYLTSHDPRVHFGLGAADSIDQIAVVWPDGVSETFSASGCDKFMVLRRGEGSSP